MAGTLAFWADCWRAKQAKKGIDGCLFVFNQIHNNRKSLESNDTFQSLPHLIKTSNNYAVWLLVKLLK